MVAIGGGKRAKGAAKQLPGSSWRLALLLACAAALWFGWIGYIASDDRLYYIEALHWLRDPPQGGVTHWGTRFPLILSFAGSIALFGQNFGAFEATALFWYAALVATAGLCAGAVFGERAGWIGAILIGTLPVVAGSASIVNCDAPEAVFLIGGAWLLGTAKRDRQAATAGACFALAVLTRETAVLAITGLALPFLIGRPIPRRLFLLAVAGFLAVISAEALFQWVVSGDPLHRYTLAAHHDSHIDRAANREGNLIVHPIVDPLLVLLVNNEFGLLFWLAGAAIVLRGRDRRARVSPVLALLTALAVANIVIIGLLHDFLVLNPRYFTLAAVVAAIHLAGWLASLRNATRVAVLAAVVLGNIVLLGLANGHPYWRAEALATAAREHPGALILADRDTIDRAELWLRFNDGRNVTFDDRGPAALQLVSESMGRVVVASYPSPPTRIGLLLRGAKLSSLLPDPIERRVMAPSAPAFLVERRLQARRMSIGK